MRYVVVEIFKHGVLRTKFNSRESALEYLNECLGYRKGQICIYAADEFGYIKEGYDYKIRRMHRS